MARALKLLRKQIQDIVGPEDFRAVKQLEDLFRRVADTSLVVRSVTSTTTVNDTDDLIVADGTLTVTLPPASAFVGRVVTVKNAGAGTVTVSTTDLIDGAATYPMPVANQSVTVASTGATWVIL